MLDMSLWILAEIARARARYWDEVADMWAARNQPARAAHERLLARRYRALAHRAEALEERGQAAGVSRSSARPSGDPR